MNRIDRVTAILIQLQSKKTVKAQEISDRFNISLRTVYRDIRTLEEAGIPIIGEAGVGYSIMEGYRLPPVQFTYEEATAFLTAEKLIEKFTDTSTDTAYKSAMYKVRSVLRSHEKDSLENMEEQIVVKRNYAPFRTENVNNTLQVLLKSVAEKKVLRMEYKTPEAEDATSRHIEPLGIFYASGYWHAIAWCQLREGYRDFRTDRILKLTPTETPFPKSHPSLNTYLQQVATRQNLETVVIQVNKDVARYLEEAKYYYGFVSEKQLPEKVEMTFLCPSLEVFARWYTMFADAAEITAPAPLSLLVKEYLKKISKKF